MRKKSLTGASVGLVILAAATLLTSAPAQAAEAPAQATEAPAPATGTPMRVVGFNAEVARAHGYELRTDGRGIGYSVPVANRPGDLTGAALVGSVNSSGAITTQGSSGGVTTQSTVWGDCGTSWFDFTQGNSQFTTGYSIAPNYGGPISHTWGAWVQTTGMGGQAGSYDLSGLAPWGTPTWSTSRKVTQNYTGHAKGSANGTVLTSNGTYCSSGTPNDSY